MTVLQKGRAIYPFWGESIKLITGLDPLSLQTTSEATYSTLLPGISNLTNRLRYYGFYCWLLDFYFKNEKTGNSTEQFKFIRRAELMVALIMQFERKEVLQITGSNFANNLIINQSDENFDLAIGADKTKENIDVYWKYPSGAFGQYYYGAMRALSLVVATSNDDGDVIYNITQPNARQKVSGKELADAFDGSLTLAIKDLFYKNIKYGKLSREDIPGLVKYFFIDKVSVNNDEWPLYVAMLLDKDDPAQEVEESFTYHRRETILELLQSALVNEGKYDWYTLLLKAYEEKLGTSSKPTRETLIGWYTYQFNEYFQFANGTIFWATLQHLYSFQQDQYLPSFVNNLAKAITKELSKKMTEANFDGTLKQALYDLQGDKDEEILYRKIETKLDSSPVLAATNGFLLLFKLYNNNREDLYPLKEFMNRNQMTREGNMADGLLSLHTSENDKLEDFIEQYLLRKIIYRHQMVAIRKMGSGTQSSLKFIIEEQYIRFIDTFPPRSTSPRLNALENLLLDLGVIDSESMLTSLHEKLLEE